MVVVVEGRRVPLGPVVVVEGRLVPLGPVVVVVVEGRLVPLGPVVVVVVEGRRVPLGPVPHRHPDPHLLHPRHAVVRGGHRPLDQPRAQPDARV